MSYMSVSDPKQTWGGGLHGRPLKFIFFSIQPSLRSFYRLIPYGQNPEGIFVNVSKGPYVYRDPLEPSYQFSDVVVSSRFLCPCQVPTPLGKTWYLRGTSLFLPSHSLVEGVWKPRDGVCDRSQSRVRQTTPIVTSTLRTCTNSCHNRYVVHIYVDTEDPTR